MEKSNQSDEAFSEMIPNPAGLPCQNTDSEQVRKAHRQWKTTAGKRSRENKVSELSYWQKASSCNAL